MRRPALRPAPALRGGGPLSILFVTLLLASLTGLAWSLLAPASSAALAPELSGLDWDGRGYSLAAEAGKVRLVFFGYTCCPVVCPVSLARARLLRAGLDAARAADLSVVF